MSAAQQMQDIYHFGLWQLIVEGIPGAESSTNLGYMEYDTTAKQNKPHPVICHSSNTL
jgi:hypothetical protein